MLHQPDDANTVYREYKLEFKDINVYDSAILTLLKEK